MTRICFILLSVLALAFANGEAWAQAWPTRPIRAIVAFSAGGIVDVMARVVCDQLSSQVRQPVVVENRGDIERDLTALARSPNGGVVVTSSPEASRHRHLIITLAARHRLPAIYSYRSFAVEGGLISYGPDMVDQYRRAAAYVDRILKGEKPTDLPVQAPTKYELVINVRTAKALGLDLPPALLAGADEVIE